MYKYIRKLEENKNDLNLRPGGTYCEHCTTSVRFLRERGPPCSNLSVPGGLFFFSLSLSTPFSSLQQEPFRYVGFRLGTVNSQSLAITKLQASIRTLKGENLLTDESRQDFSPPFYGVMNTQCEPNWQGLDEGRDFFTFMHF